MQQKNGGAQAIFALAAEAYDVLSDPLRKAVYDQYGEEGLKNGVPRPEGFVKPYVYHGDPTRAFRWNRKPLSSRRLKSLNLHLNFLRDEILNKKTFLLQVFFGGIKKMKIRRLIVVNNDKSTLPTKKILTIPIKPGIPAGTRIVFPEESDQGSAKIPADVIFVTEDRLRETFRREDSDLHTTVDIFLREALTGTVITLNTVDGRTLRIPITPIVTYEKPL
ncbi:LOW QUALITY PROTEIN: dnaJ homolog subfamily B member 13 [Cardiocondyla obscurior]|uniref:LOW QUALITY PROTEIN: dnaJ homolog subfamily B member 13 n=1 Tax=Cardiocondyla obscurior TaxID=286306 RepID=UPI0039656C15